MSYLTNEEKKTIGDAATEMMQAFCAFRIAEEKLRVVNTLSGNLAQVIMSDEMFKNALDPYARQFKEMQNRFFDALGIPLTNKEFWDWYRKQPPSMEQLKISRIQDKVEEALK